MTDYSKITALYSRLSVGDEDRDGGYESTPAFPWATRTGTAARATAYRTKRYYVEGGFSHLIHMTAAHLW